jgi:dissimilatory sulfite reductase related protein
MNRSHESGATASGHKLRLFGGREILVDHDGFLVDPTAWTEEVAVEMAREQGLEVIEETHWETIRFLREYYFTHGKAPMGRDIKKGTGLSLLEIERLFPGGLKEGARRLAGLPNLRGCM